MSLLKYFIIEIRNISIKTFESINLDSFSNSIKYISDSNTSFKNKPKNCFSFFKCHLKKKSPLKDEKFNIEIFQIVLNLRKTLKELINNKLKIMINESCDSIFDIDKIDNIIQEICFNKYQYLLEVNNLDEKLKDEVDKYSEYFNIDKILKKQNVKFKSQNKKIEQQENCKTAIECIICIENIRNTIFFPCMHLITCESCGFNKIKLDCPQCHKKIEKKQIISL